MGINLAFIGLNSMITANYHGVFQPLLMACCHFAFVHSTDLQVFLAHPLLFGVFKSKGKRGTGHLARIGRGSCMLGCDRKERDCVEDPGIGGKIILKYIFKKCYGGMDWINLAQDRDRCWALVDRIMTLVVSKNGGNFLTN